MANALSLRQANENRGDGRGGGRVGGGGRGCGRGCAAAVAAAAAATRLRWWLRQPACGLAAAEKILDVFDISDVSDVSDVLNVFRSFSGVFRPGGAYIVESLHLGYIINQLTD